MSTRFRFLLALAISVAVQVSAQTMPSLKDTYKKSFLIGAAVSERQFFERDALGSALVKAQFNTITPENVLKWEVVHPQPDQYNFTPADQYVAFGEKNHMFIVGHTLIWHNQTPAWVFQNEKGQPLTRDQLLARMREHILTVVGRYKGRIKGWDVVNEALDEDGTLRQTPWMKIIGPDYIEKAFEFAHAADPDAELYYNDYSLENEAKRNGAVALITRLREHSVFVTGVGIQGHDNLTWPTVEQEDATLAAFAQLAVKVMITELDIDVLPAAAQSGSADVSLKLASRPELNPYASGLPGPVQRELAKRYADLFQVFLKHRDVVQRVTFWGVTDADSWKNDWPIKGRTNYPLLFDRNGKPKPAFDAVIQLVQP